MVSVARLADFPDLMGRIGARSPSRSVQGLRVSSQKCLSPFSDIIIRIHYDVSQEGIIRMNDWLKMDNSIPLVVSYFSEVDFFAVGGTPMEEVAQEIYEYSRRGRLTDLLNVVSKIHPDAYIAYDGSTALLMACKHGHVEVCRLLIEHGADPGMRTDEGSTALLLAACTGNAELVRLILEKRMCDINEWNEDGFTPLDLALHYSHSEIADILRAHGGRSSAASTPESGEVLGGPSEKWGYGVFDQ